MTSEPGERTMGEPDAPTIDLRTRRIATLSALVVGASLLAATLPFHVDDIDAQLYRVIARNMARSGRWLDPSFLPGLWPHFREHLPFGFWPAALALSTGGSLLANIVYGLFSLATLLVVAWAAHQLYGGLAGAGAALILATTESFWHYGSRILLEPPLLFFSTAACALLLARGEPRPWAASALASIAILVKGPFGLLTFSSAALGKLLSERKPRGLPILAAAVGLSVIPVVLFLALDRLAGDGSWWQGYVLNQLAASTLGTRSDGIASRWFPLAVIGGRFWPGLPFLGLSAFGLLRPAASSPTPAGLEQRRNQRAFWITCAFTIAGLCIPQRKWGNHSYVVFPLLAIVAGGGFGFVFTRLPSHWIRRGFLGLAIVSVLVTASGLGQLVLRPACSLASKPFRAALSNYPPGMPIMVVGDPSGLLTIQVADETALEPRRVSELVQPSPANLALLPAGSLLPPGWVRIVGDSRLLLAGKK